MAKSTTIEWARHTFNPWRGLHEDLAGGRGALMLAVAERRDDISWTGMELYAARAKHLAAFASVVVARAALDDAIMKRALELEELLRTRSPFAPVRAVELPEDSRSAIFSANRRSHG